MVGRHECEMKSMAHNDVWELVEQLERVKSIGCKWVFKTKKDSKGNVKRYKTRLVAKDFTKKEFITLKPFHVFPLKIPLELLWP